MHALRQVAEPGRPRECRHRPIGWQPVKERVLRRPRLDSGGQPRERPAVPEELPLAQHVEDSLVVGELDLPAADDPDMLEVSLALPEHGLAGGSEFDLDRGREVLERVLRKRVERLVTREELDYVVHGRVRSPGASRRQFCDGSAGIRAISAYCPPFLANTSLHSVAGSSGNSSLGNGASMIQDSISISASSCPGPHPE